MSKYEGIGFAEATVIFNNPKVHNIFKNLCEGRDPATVYRWVYMIVNRIAEEEDISLQLAMENSLKNGQLLGDIIDKVHEQKELTRSGGKQLIRDIIDCKYNDGTTVQAMIT